MSESGSLPTVSNVMKAVLTRAWLLWVLVASLMLPGCATTERADGVVVEVTAQKLATDLKTLQTLQPQLKLLQTELADFHRSGGWQQRGYLDAAETRDVETLLFRFTTYHSVLREMVRSYGEPATQPATSELQARGHVLSAYATLLLVHQTSGLVSRFAGDEIAIAQLNQAYYRSDIPFGTYDRARESVTSGRYREAVQAEQALYDEVKSDPRSFLTGIAGKDLAYASIVNDIPLLLDVAEKDLARIEAVYPSGFKASVDLQLDTIGQHKVLYGIRSAVFKNVSRLKSPSAQVIRFSDTQQQEIYAQLQPGDLVLTYTAGYVSSVFIPGAFKHGITFIGSVEQRVALDLTLQDLPQEQRYQPDVLARHLQQMNLDNGAEADMIEAVAEGVIFNNLGHIMNTHVNRMLVLRPRLSAGERRAFMAGLFSYLGDGYDFRFDFADSTYQVCTEVIYRELDGKGGIKFSLTERAGHVTLSADDIVNDYLSVTPPVFDFVLYAEEDPASKTHQARILLGAEGEARVKSLMASME